MASSDIELPPSITSPELKKKKKKSTKTTDGKNEGKDPSWPYQPPAGAELLDHSADHAEFDWDAINDNPDIELWAIRVPHTVKPKHLEDLVVDPLSKDSSKTTRISSHTRKHYTYELYDLGKDTRDVSIGGEELKTVTCLLPRKSKKGRLYKAPKPISRHLVLRIAPNVDEDISSGEVIPRQNAPRQAYPPELLTHRFMPYGSQAPDKVTSPEEKMDVDVVDTKEVETPAKPKKRKGVNETSPKKAKKAKRTVS